MNLVDLKHKGFNLVVRSAPADSAEETSYDDGLDVKRLAQSRPALFEMSDS